MTAQWREAAVALSLCLLCAEGALAQHQAPPPDPASRPSQAAMRQPGTIFDYRAELRLTVEQEQAIQDLLANLNLELTRTRARLTLLEIDRESLLRKDGDFEQVKQLVHEETQLAETMRLLDLTATFKINREILSPAQVKRWRQIQALGRVPDAGAP